VISRPPGFRGTFRTDDAARAAYSEGAGPYRIVPAAVAIPEDRDELALLVDHAREEGWPLVPRGAGSGMPGGNVGDGVLVDLGRFDRPLEITAAEGAVVGAAVTWQALDAAAARHGLRFPPDPSSGAFCTLGGMVATNAAGARSVRAGAVRRWVRSVELITGDAEVTVLRRDEGVPSAPETGTGPLRARFAAIAQPLIRDSAGLIRARYPRTRKNSAGYALDAYLETGDLLDLVIGSEGTLGFITRVEVQLEPRPPAVAGVLIGLTEMASLSDVIATLLRLGPAALELLDRSFLTVARAKTPFPLDGVEAVLLVDFEGTESAVRAAAAEAVRVTERHAAFAYPALSSEDRTRMWALRHAASPELARLPDSRRSLQLIEDGCVPVPALGTYLAQVRRVAADLEIEIVAFGHAGDGHLHVNALVDTTADDFVGRVATLFERVTEIVIALGGTPSGEHGDGRLRSGAVGSLYGPEILAVLRRVKDAFDPAGILNPGVVLAPEDAAPIAQLKVGRDVASIPTHVATGLRNLERTGQWGIPKLELLTGGDAR
jgi:FAD/FMN-containing dehydrogenase